MTALDFTLVLNLIGAIQALVLGSMLLARGLKNRNNIFLGALIIVFGIIIVNTLMILSGIAHHYPFYQRFSNAITLLIGPIIFLLITSCVSGENWQSKHWGHFVLFFIYFFLSLSLEYSSYRDSDYYHALFYANKFIMPWLWNVQMAVYTYLSLKICYQSSQANQNLKTIKALSLYVGSIWLINFILLIIKLTLYQLPDSITLNITLLLASVVIFMAFKSFTNPFFQVSTSSLISKTQKEIWLTELEEIIAKRRLYTDQTLRLSDLSSEMGISSRMLSQLIKEEYGQNFNEYLNSYRAKEVIRLLESKKTRNYTIMALANEAGFKSNSVFYKAFKTMTGLTPVAYMQRLSK